MNDQIILKSPYDGRFLRVLERNPHITFMPIIRKSDELDIVFSHDINLVAAETVFSSDSEDIVQVQLIEKLHKRNVLLWVNAITLDDFTVLSGGHDDNRSIMGDIKNGWE